jgi:hypothetical protein
MRCHQCERPALWNVGENGPALCLECMHKLQQIQNAQFVQNAAMLNLAMGEMDAVGELFGVPASSRLIPVAAIAQSMRGKTVLNNISINNSTVGLVNTGDLAKIDAAITLTRDTDAEAIGAQIQKLTQAIIDSGELTPDQKKEMLDLVQALADQVVRERKPSVMNALLTAIKERTEGAANIVTVVQGLAELIRGLFGS